MLALRMSLMLEPYLMQKARWPRAGRHVIAQYDDETVVVYQAYLPTIGRFAAEHGYFGRDFSLSRMSWIKPSFLWTMYRSGWATKEGQEVVLAVWMARSAFDAILAQAVPSTFVGQYYPDRATWQAAVAASSVRLQWDPDRDPYGAAIERRAIQLGLRGQVLTRYASEWIRRIEDVTPFVREQQERLRRSGPNALITPVARVYPVTGTNQLGVSVAEDPQ